jgi:hypothetical protein
MENSFEDVMSKKSNEELIAIITIDRSKYQESAIISAEKEVEKRNIDIMSNRTNQELIDIVTTDRFKYQEKFIDSANKEIEKRDIDKTFIDEFKENATYFKESELKQENLNQIYNYSYNLINIENKSLDEVKFILTEKGHNENDISWVIRQLLFKEEEKNKANNDMLYGALWCVGGIAATIAEIGYIFWGAILFGAIQFFKGASNVEIFKNK